MSVTYPYTDYPIAVPQGARLAIPCWRTDSEGAYRNFATDTVVGEVRRYHDDVTPIAVFDCAVIDNPVTSMSVLFDPLGVVTLTPVRFSA